MCIFLVESIVTFSIWMTQDHDKIIEDIIKKGLEEEKRRIGRAKNLDE